MLKKKLLTDRSGQLEEKILAEQSKTLQREIDKEVLWNMLSELGWIRIILPGPLSINKLMKIHLWIKENCKGAYETNRSDFIFELERDAMWFKLRWLS